MWWLFSFPVIVFFIILGVIYWYKSHPKKDDDTVGDNIFNQSHVNTIKSIVSYDLKILKSKDLFIARKLSIATKNFTYKNEFISYVKELIKTLEVDSTVFEMFIYDTYKLSLYSLEERLISCFSNYSVNKKKNIIKSVEFYYDIETNSYVIYLVLKQTSSIILIFEDIDLYLIQEVITFLEVDLDNNKIDLILNDSEGLELEVTAISFMNKNNFIDLYAFTDDFDDDKEDIDFNYDEEFDESNNLDDENIDFDDDFYESYENYDNEFVKKSQKDYYGILGVPKNASKEEIIKAYRNKAKQWHPDVCTDKKATEMMKQINEAYSILFDDKKRQEYDLYND